MFLCRLRLCERASFRCSMSILGLGLREFLRYRWVGVLASLCSRDGRRLLLCILTCRRASRFCQCHLVWRCWGSLWFLRQRCLCAFGRLPACVCATLLACCGLRRRDASLFPGSPPHLVSTSSSLSSSLILHCRILLLVLCSQIGGLLRQGFFQGFLRLHECR